MYAGAYSRAGGIVAALSLGLWPVSGVSQDTSGGLIADLTFSELLVWDDGISTLRSDLGFGLSSKTNTQEFALNFGAGLDKSYDNDELNADVIDPRASLFYAIESRNTRFEFDASYRKDDIDTLTALDVLGETAFVLDEGDREDTSFGLSYEFGRDAPFGGVLRYDYDKIEYTDTISSTLLDSERNQASLRLRFEINTAVTARAVFRVSELDRVGGIDIDRQSIGAGASIAINEASTLDFELGHTEVTQSGSVARSSEDGLYYTLAYTTDLPNGNIRASLRSNINESGRRTTARVDRKMDLPRGSLSFGAGLSQNDVTNDTNPLYSVSYTHDLPRGAFTASFRQAFSSTNAGDETLDSRLSLNYQQELTNLSNFSAGMSFRDTNVLEGTSSDAEQLNLNLNYAHEITKDWSAIAGYTHVRRESDSGSNSTDDEVFIGVRTSLQWRP